MSIGKTVGIAYFYRQFYHQRGFKWAKTLGRGYRGV